MINRNNYEEYLLMYLDGELSSSERESVEVFLDENPDLKEELALLQQTILQPEEQTGFAGKELLYRKESGISISNYQEYFLLYIDNELNAADKQAVETFVLQQPRLQEEFTLLKQTVLPKEWIVFADKASLYRKEEKRRPVVISLRWASMAAAVLLGIVALVMFNKQDNNAVDKGFAAKPVNEKPQISTRSSTTNSKEVLPVTTVTEEARNASTNTNSFATVNKTTGNNINTQPLKEPVSNENLQQQPIAGNYQTSQQTTTVITPTDNQAVSNYTAPTNNTFSANSGVEGEEKNIASSSTENDYAQPAVYTEELETEEDKTLYVGSMQVNPDKVRGFFRKASRFLSSKVKSNDGEDDGKGKVKVANIEMNKIK